MPPTYDRRMLLAVDIGNTNLTLGIVEDGALESVRRAATSRASTADELEVLLRDLLALDDHALHGVAAMAVASVVPAATATLSEVAARLGIPVLLASSGTVPIAIRVDRPDLVGADRIVNALAAARLHGTPAVVVDCGTATTLDCVGADGAFVGGAIAPGLELGLDALAARTAKLPRVDLRAPDRVDRPRHRRRDPGRDGDRVPGARRGPRRPGEGRAGRRRRPRPGPRPRDPHRRGRGGAVGPGRRRHRPHRPGSHAQGPRDPARRGRGRRPVP